MDVMEKYSYEDIIEILRCGIGITTRRCNECPLYEYDCLNEMDNFLENISESPIEWIKTCDVKTLNEIFSHKDEIYSAVMSRDDKTANNIAAELSKQLNIFPIEQKKKIIEKLNAIINNKEK